MLKKLRRFFGGIAGVWSKALTGTLIGFSLGIVQIAAFFGFPYVGAYPSLPAFVLISGFVEGKTMDHAAFYIPVAITNIVLWSVVGFVVAAIGGIINPRRRNDKQL